MTTINTKEEFIAERARLNAQVKEANDHYFDCMFELRGVAQASSRLSERRKIVSKQLEAIKAELLALDNEMIEIQCKHEAAKLDVQHAFREWERLFDLRDGEVLK